MIQPLTDAPEPTSADPHVILVVEDEVIVRMVIAAHLRECGFRVIEAQSADEAMTLLEADTPVDLVFSDVHLPGTHDGFSLARWIRRERPGIRVILTSGVAKAAEVAEDLCGDGPLMPKPYDPAGVAARIRAALARKGADAAG